MKIPVFGDIHGEWQIANKLMSKVVKRHAGVTHMFHVGDLADGWPEFKTDPMTGLGGFFKGYSTWNPVFQPFHWCDGNHENFDRLKDPALRNPKLIYQERGSVLEINGYRIMFFGGAESIDRDSRTPGISWWPEEKIEYGQVMRVLREDLKPIDCIVSHDKPLCFPNPHELKGECGLSDRQALEALWDFFRPRFWFFGHYHVPMHTEFEQTTVTCCPIINSGKYCIWDGETVELSRNWNQ